VFFSLLWVGAFTWNWAPIIIFKKRNEAEQENERDNQVNQKLGRDIKEAQHTVLHGFYYLVTDAEMMYGLIFVGLSALGVWTPAAYSFHLLDISFRNQQTRNVLQAVTTNGISILLTALLGLFIMYIYSVIAFFTFTPDYVSNSLDCVTIYQCACVTLYHGLLTGSGIGTALPQANWDSGEFAQRFFFDLTFFIIIVIILLNMVFGIILDTFGQLRDEKAAIEEDIQSRCFICSVASDVFQRQAFGFKHHSNIDHNVWNYLYFFVYLDLKDRDDYTNAEDFIAKKRASKNQRIAYFPISRAISLEDDELEAARKKKGDE